MYDERIIDIHTEDEWDDIISLGDYELNGILDIIIDDLYGDNNGMD